MKKLLKVLAASTVAILTALLLVSCGNGKKLTAEMGKEAEQYHLTKLNDTVKNRVINLFVYKAADPFIQGTVVPGFENAFANVGFTNIKLLDGNSDPTTQNNQIRTSLNEQDILIVNSATPQSATGVIDVVKDTKKPIVFFNREMENDQLNAYDNAFFVGTSRRQPGELQGQFVAKQVFDHFKDYDKNHDGKIKYIVLIGEAGNPEAVGRTAGAKEVVAKEFKRLVMALPEAERTPEKLQEKFGENFTSTTFDDVFVMTGEYVSNPVWDSASAKNTVNTEMSKDENKKPEVIFSNNDGMAIGALEALQAAGFNKGFDENGNLDRSKHILITGVDGLDNAQDRVAKGQLSFTVLQDGAKLGAVTTQVAVNLLNGKKAFDGLTTQFPGLFVDPECDKKVRVPYKPITVKIARQNRGEAELTTNPLPFE